MDDFDTAFASARDSSAFSNGTDWEIWSYNNCETCAHDAETRTGDAPLGAGCPLILVAYMGRTPREWIPGEDKHCGDKYACVMYRHEDEDDPDPKPIPDPPGMDALFPREICEGPRILLPVPEAPVRSDAQTAGVR